MDAGAAGSLTGAAELFRFWVFPDCTFLDISTVLFVNTPMKVMNPEYERIGVVPINISIRKEIGREIEPEDVGQVNTVVEEMMARRGEYQERIRKLACQNVYNLGQSAQCSGKFILSELNKKKGNTQSAGASEKG